MLTAHGREACGTGQCGESASVLSSSTLSLACPRACRFSVRLYVLISHFHVAPTPASGCGVVRVCITILREARRGRHRWPSSHRGLTGCSAVVTDSVVLALPAKASTPFRGVARVQLNFVAPGACPLHGSGRGGSCSSAPSAAPTAGARGRAASAPLCLVGGSAHLEVPHRRCCSISVAGRRCCSGVRLVPQTSYSMLAHGSPTARQPGDVLTPSEVAVDSCRLGTSHARARVQIGLHRCAFSPWAHWCAHVFPSGLGAICGLVDGVVVELTRQIHKRRP